METSAAPCPEGVPQERVESRRPQVLETACSRRVTAPSYLQQLVAEPSPAASWMHPDAPPTPLEAAQRRLAVGMLLSERLGDEARHLYECDAIEAVGRRMLGFDHFAELEKLQSFGEAAAMARSSIVAAPHCSGYATSGLVPAYDAPPTGWQYFKADGCTVVQAGGLELSRHPVCLFNGAYRAVDERDGWPVLQNEHGMWLFRVGPWARSRGDTGDSWRLSHEHTWDVDECNSYSISADGSLPVGDRSWHTIDGTTRLFAPRTMTMSVVVRAREHASILGRTRPFHQLMRSWLAHCRRTTALELAH